MKSKNKNIYLRILGIICLVIVMLLIFIFGVITVICKGPFPTSKELFVVSVNETSAIKFLSNIYFTKDEVAQIIKNNSIVETDEVTDVSKEFTGVDETKKDDIELVDVYGRTYTGKMIIVHDPSRVSLATLPVFGEKVVGKTVEKFVEEENAIAGINAGGFLDLNGVGTGGLPLGNLIKDGKIISGSPDFVGNVVGFDANHRLVVGVMSGQEALDLGVQESVYFFPTLIVNGKPAEVAGTGGGLNPRTVIGQREDGAVLLLVIDGRQPHSVGASFEDCIEQMLAFGAVNASNLDGGSSSIMIYNGEMVNVCASLYGSRAQPAAWVVK